MATKGSKMEPGFHKRSHLYQAVCKDSGAKLFCQMLGYSFTFVIHVSNLMFLEVEKVNESSTITNDPKVKMFRKLLFRYLTCWTVFTQILNSIVGFSCGAAQFLHMGDKRFRLPEDLQQTREIMFAGVVWPCSMVVCTVFWSLYLYDRSLIYPEFVDGVIGPASNHILHTIIVPIVIWEVVFRKREKPYSHKRNLQQMLTYMAVYMCVFYYTFYSEGVWLYPIFEVTYGTIDFLTLHLAIAALFFMFYYLQWGLNDLVHGNKVENKKVN